MKYIQRNSSIITGKANLEHLYTITNFPVFISYIDYKDKKKDIRADMHFYIDPESGIIQLSKVLPLNIVYQQGHSVGLGTVWENHYIAFSQFIARYNPSQVLEIGGGNGILARLLTKNKKDVKWTIVEPLPLCKESKNIKIIKGWFNKGFSYDKKIDTIVHSHVLEHMYDPREFIDQIYHFLAVGEKHIFSVPNLYKWLTNKYINTLNFEHTIFLTEALIDYILISRGFTIIQKQYYLDHSIFYATQKTKDKQKIEFISKYEEYKKLFNEFISYYTSFIRKINLQISQSDLDVYLFGAHIFSQFLLEFGLDITKIRGILDNASIKQNKMLYGTSLPIISPETIKGSKPIMVILKAAGYQEEIKSQLVVLNKNAIILE